MDRWGGVNGIAPARRLLCRRVIPRYCIPISQLKYGEPTRTMIRGRTGYLQCPPIND